MQWIKSHLTVVITSTVSLVAIVLLVLGVMNDEVSKTMQSDTGTLSNLQSTRKPVNERIIEVVVAEQNKIQQQLDKNLEQFKNIGTHKPINTNVFPTVKPDQANAPFKFKADYKNAQKQLIVELKAGERPTQEDIEREKKRLDAEQTTMEAGEGRKDPRGIKPEQPGTAKTTTPKVAKIDKKDPSKMTIEELIAEDPEARLSLENASRCYCYANVDTSLQQFTHITHDEKYRPTSEEMWDAQMALWIQQDVIRALAGLNEGVAEKLPAKDRWVGNLPVKHLLGFWVGGYVTTSTSSGGSRTPSGSSTPMMRTRGGEGASFGGSSNVGAQLPNGAPSGNPSDVFTNNSCKGGVDVVQFAINLVIDAKMLPSVLNAVCEAGFYTPLMVTYEAAPQGKLPIGYIYGSAPILAVRLEFEGSFLRKKYEEWMPDTIKAAVEGIQSTGTGGASE